MLNSFLSHLLFGNSSSNDQQLQYQQQQQQQQQELQQQQYESGSSSSSIKENLNSQSAIKINDNEKFIDVRNDVDWVIIDPSDNDEVKKHLKRKLNSMAKSMQMSEYGLTNLFDIAATTYATNCGASDGATLSDESMDRSLSFDESVQSRPMTPQLKEPIQQQQQQQQVVMNCQPQQQQMIEQDAWLITPLPSLVSLQTSQKSINEIAPLENLLIEHPSMSVFITQDEINESEEAIADSSSFALIDKDENKPGIEQQKSKKNKKKAKKPQQQVAEVQPAQQQPKAVTTTTNKENQQAVQQQQQQQPRSQLCNKATSNKCLISSQFYKERCNQLKLQEKCKYYVKNVNLKQRKYHNLQQPQYLNVNFVNIRH